MKYEKENMFEIKNCPSMDPRQTQTHRDQRLHSESVVAQTQTRSYRYNCISGMRVTLRICVYVCVCLCLRWPRGLLQNFYCRCRYTSLIFSISISILFLSSRSTPRWTWTWMSMSMWLATFPMFFSLSTHLCVALASPHSPPCSTPRLHCFSKHKQQKNCSHRNRKMSFNCCSFSFFLSLFNSHFPFSHFHFLLFMFCQAAGVRAGQGREPTFPWLFFPLGFST